MSGSPYEHLNLKSLSSAPIYGSGDFEQKSVSSYSSGLSFVDHLYQRGLGGLGVYKSLEYYLRNSILFDAIDDIAERASSISPVIWDRSRNEFIREHPLLDLLKRPKLGTKGKQFRYNWISYRLACGNAFAATHAKSKNDTPLELVLHKPLDVTLSAHTDGYSGDIRVNGDRGGLTYSRDEVISDDFRFINMQDGFFKEIRHSSSFNPYEGSGNLWGVSKVFPLYPEIEQFMLANTHNSSVLRRGATPSMLFSVAGSLENTQRTALKEQIDEYFSGAHNAGRPILGEGGMDVKPLTMSNKDMDFDRLMSSLTARVYNMYDIPLPSVTPEQMTLANMDASTVILYEQAVLPVLDMHNEEMSELLVWRYPDLDPDIHEITYDPSTIKALESRRMESLKSVHSTRLLTVNELRDAYLNREGIENGDTVYVDSNIVPVGEDRYREDMDSLRSDMAQLRGLMTPDNADLPDGSEAVSYTHLTLPTIYSV